MRFKKEILITSFILLLIVSLEILTSRLTKNITENMKYKIEDLEKVMTIIDEKQRTIEKAKRMEEDWKKAEEKLSFFTEHNELDKISEDIISIKSNIENDEIANALEKITEIKLRIQHVQNKQKIKLNNIF